MSSQSSTSSKRALFIKLGSFSGINQSLLESLRRQMPYVIFDVIDIYDIVGKRNIICAISALCLYWKDILLRRRSLASVYLRSPYAFRLIKSKLNKIYRQSSYSFTLQTQSLWDSSSSLLPSYVYTDHVHLANTQNPHSGITSLCHPSWIELERTIYLNASTVFTMSSNISRCLSSLYDMPTSRISCVYAGPNLPVTQTAIPSSRNHTKNVLFVGIDWDRKGGEVLRAAFLRVLRVHPDAHLTIIGCKPHFPSPNVTILGLLPSHQLSTYYLHANIFCMPTLHEPFGISFLEAMSFSLPVVSTNIGALPDIVEHSKTGFLAPPGDSSALAEYLIKLLSFPSTAKSFGIAGRRRMEERYSWPSVAKSISHTIEQSIHN